MTARQRGFEPPPVEGVVEVRVRGLPGDVERAAALLADLLGARLDKDYAFEDRNGVTVRRYLSIDLRSLPAGE
jgi:hypothetical protein